MRSPVTELLRCEIPVQLAPMGSACVTARLPLAVAAAGGHGMYAALGMPARALAPVLDALAARTRAFGVNFLVPLMKRDALELAAAHAPYVDFFLADPDPALVAVVHAGGGRCGWQVESADEARAAEAAGCDVVVVKGWESGGRKRFEGAALLPLLEDTASAVGVPIVAAGGIATARGVAAARAAGADGVRLGTRFIATTESEAHPDWKRAIVDARAEDAVVSLAFNTGMPEPGPSRVLRRCIDAAARLPEDEPVGVVRYGAAEIPAPRFSPMAPTDASTGAIEAMPYYAGQSAGAVDRIAPAAEVVAELRAAF